ncbi:MAG: TRAP transporter large permease subunit [Treponema sp.]|nr:TRAP transporter large permease subunit [Treponema sp.]
MQNRAETTGQTTEKGPQGADGEPSGAFHTFLYGVENGACILSMVSLALLPVIKAAKRLITHTGISGVEALIAHLLLLTAMLTGMITTRKEEHLSIALVQYFSGETVKRRLRIFTNLLSAFVVTLLAFCGPAFIKIGLTGRNIGFIPDRVFAAIIPLGYMVIACRFARRTGFKGWKRIFPAAAVLLGVFLSFPQIAKFIWEYDLPGWAFAISDNLSLAAWYLRVPAVILLLVSALAGTPLFVVMAGLVLALLEAMGSPLDVIATDIYSALTNDNIIAIPLFTLVGFFLSESRAGERLVTAFRRFFSWIPGGMIIATVIICAFFTSFTGASGVTILALGGILYTILSGHITYPERFSVGLLTSVGSVGLLFPPSIPLILVATLSQTDVLRMFAGGLIPGFILTAAVIVFGIIASVHIKIPVEPFRLKPALSSLGGSALEIILPFFLVISYFTGFLSLVEIGAVAAVYIFIVEIFIHRDIAPKDIHRVFLKAVPIIGGVLAILALSQSLSFFIIDTNAPANLAEWMQNTVSSKFLFLLLLNLALLVVGCLMDIFSAILIILPLVVPLGQAYGIEPVHLGIIFIINLEVGFLTPPVGLNLFLASYRFKRPFVEICRCVFPFLVIQFAVVLLVTYVPALSLWLPGLFGR